MGNVCCQPWLLLDQRAQLIQRVKRQKLYAAAPVDIILTEPGDGLRHQAIRAAVAVGDGQANASAAAVQQDIIDAPGIYADAVDEDPAIADFFEPGTDLRLKFINVPGIKAVLFLQAVRKTMHLAKGKGVLVAVPGGEHYTAAGCA